MRNEPDLLPPPVLMLLTASFEPGAVSLIGPTLGGFSHYSALVMVEEQPCVVKAADLPLQRADVRREARMLALLQGSGLPVPELVALFEDETWSVALLGALTGANALQLYAQAPTDLLRLAGELGRLLARLHQPAAAPADPDLLIANRMAQLQKQLSRLDVPAELRNLFDESLAPTHWSSSELCIVHGDAGVHNILWDDTITGLLDWEWSGWGNPAQDLAWLAWTLRFRQAPPELWDELKRSYLQAGGRFPDLEPSAVRALVFGQMAAIMLRAQTPDLQAEWIRRMRWTMEMKLRW